MSTNKTTHYGLHLWEPEDKFMREEFNENNEKLDIAVQGAVGTAESAAGKMEALGYNVYNLILQNYYDGKRSDYKKAVFFDGFANHGQIATLTTGLSVNTAEKYLLLDAMGQQMADYAFGTSISYTVTKGFAMSEGFTATGSGTLTQLSFYAAASVLVTIKKGGAEVARQQSGGGMPATVSCSVPIKTGEQLTITLTNNSGATNTYYRANSGLSGFGYRLMFTPTQTTSGTLTSSSYPVGSGEKLLLWMRHNRGTISVQVLTGGVWQDMITNGSRSAFTLSGESCRESGFYLDMPVTGAIQVRLGLHTSARQNLTVFDYGGILI